jgi:anti-sigma factor RsiW
VTCDEISKRLHAYLDAELSADQSAAVETHILACRSCRDAIAKRQRLGTLVQGASLAPLPEGFADRVLLRAQQPASRSHASRRTIWNSFKWWTRLPMPGRVAAAAVVLAAIAAGSVMGWQTAKASVPSPPVESPVALYNLDYLGSRPVGSLPQAYLTLVSTSDEADDGVWGEP